MRLYLIHGLALDSDEATHFELVDVPLADVYQSTLTEAHPPFFYVLLHGWQLMGNSEFFLRLLSVLLGCLFLVAGYLWVRRRFGESAALVALVIFTFSPAFVSASVEVRGYSLLLFLMVCTLAAIDRALEVQSVQAMVGFAVLLYLTILTHYSAIWFTAAAFSYVIARIRRDRTPKRVIWVWTLSQIGAAVLYLFLYVTHVVRLRAGRLEDYAINRWLRPEYFHSDQESARAFLVRQTIRVFQSLFVSMLATWLGIALAMFALFLLARAKRPVALLLGVPFALGAGAGLARIYPYGGTRHSAYLLMFAAVAIGVAASVLSRGHLWPALVFIAVLIPVSCSSRPAREGRTIVRMNAAMDALRAAARPGELIFADLRTGAALFYYLGRNDFQHEQLSRAEFRETAVGGYRLIRAPVWSFNDKSFEAELWRFIQAYRLRPGQRIWLIRMGAEYDPRAALVSRKYDSTNLLRESRLEGISIIELRVPNP